MSYGAGSNQTRSGEVSCGPERGMERGDPAGESPPLDAIETGVADAVGELGRSRECCDGSGQIVVRRIMS